MTDCESIILTEEEIAVSEVLPFNSAFQYRECVKCGHLYCNECDRTTIKCFTCSGESFRTLFKHCKKYVREVVVTIKKKEKELSFLEEYKQLCIKHNKYITHCTCCGLYVLEFGEKAECITTFKTVEDMMKYLGG